MINSSERISSSFNLRSAVVVLGVFLLLSPARPAFLSALDNQIFRWNESLAPVGDAALKVVIVELPDAEVTALETDIGNATQTAALLQKIIPSKTLTVGLLLQEPLGFSAQAEALLNELQPANVPESNRSEMQRYLSTYQTLGGLIDSPQLVVGLPNAARVVNDVSVQVETSVAYAWWKLLPAWRRPAMAVQTRAEQTRAEQTRAEQSKPAGHSSQQLAPGYLSFAYEPRLNGRGEAVLVRDHQQLRPTFVARLYQQFAGSRQWQWLEPIALDLDVEQFFLGADARLWARDYSQVKTGAVTQLSLEQALTQNITANVLLLARDGDQAKRIANALVSIDQRSYAYTPYWFLYAELLLLLLCLGYLLLLLPRIPASAGLLASCLLVVVMGVVQLGWQLTQQQWLPLGVVVQFIVVGHCLLVLWQLQRDREKRMLAAAHGARYQLGLQLFRDGRGDDALQALKECYTSDAVLNLLYDIAALQERKRLYSEAVKTYQGIVKRQRHFKDCEQKVEKLIAFSSGAITRIGGDRDVAKTLIMSETTINKPVLGRYEIERELGRGAMGVVYLGRDPKISRYVAIKTLSYSSIDAKQLDEFKVRFFREAEAAGRLNHPHIVTVFDVGEEHDLAFIAMDYIKGTSLAEHASVDTLLPPEEVFRLMAQVADALEYAHQHQIIHRDIKPGNIMYESQTGVVKVTDFGVARIVDNSNTNVGDILGSPLYMSPEQLKGETVGLHTDIYSLGVTLYQLLCGKLPYGGDNLASLSYNIINEKHKGVREHRPDLPKGITRIINRALHKSPAKRFQSAREFAESLRRVDREDA